MACRCVVGYCVVVWLCYCVVVLLCGCVIVLLCGVVAVCVHGLRFRISFGSIKCGLMVTMVTTALAEKK